MPEEETGPPENPFVTGNEYRATQVMIQSAFQLAVLTCRVDEDLTAAYLECVAFSTTQIVGDQLTGCYAMLFEIATIAHATAPKGLEIVSSCDHEHCAVLQGEQNAWLDAACRGDWDAATNVAKALVKAAIAEEKDPFKTLCQFWASQLVNVAMSIAMGHVPHEHE